MGRLIENDGTHESEHRLSKTNVFPLKYGGRAYRRYGLHPGPVHERWLEQLEADRRAQAWVVARSLRPRQ